MSDLTKIQDIMWSVRYYWHTYSRAATMLFSKRRIRVGDIYEDCSYRPLLCTSIDYIGDDMYGVSLLDGKTYGCSPWHCGPTKMTAVQVSDRIKNPKDSTVDWDAL